MGIVRSQLPLYTKSGPALLKGSEWLILWVLLIFLYIVTVLQKDFLFMHVCHSDSLQNNYFHLFCSIYNAAFQVKLPLVQSHPYISLNSIFRDRY